MQMLNSGPSVTVFTSYVSLRFYGVLHDGK